METQNFKSGFIAVAGRPNVGKSTLINRLLGQMIAAVSPRPQTTRRQQFGILTLENAQIIFVDTPGIHLARHKLGDFMNEEARLSLVENDLILWVVDASTAPQEEDSLISDLLRELNRQIPIVLALNKIDKLKPEDIPERQVAYQDLAAAAQQILISASTGENLDRLIELLLTNLPEGEPYYPEDQVTDAYERDIAADLIRASAMIHLRDELPHSIAIRVDDYQERGDDGAYLAVTIFVERESQKPIIIGRKGSKIKQIGSSARQKIEAMSGRKVYLDLRVKVRKNWRNDEQALRAFGFRASN